MKIAAVTEDGTTISAHFGRAPYYVILTIEDGEIVAREQREKTGHHNFVHLHEHDHEHDHEHNHEHEHHGRHDPRGHGFGKGAAQRHASMIEGIIGCDALLSRGMGQGAFNAIQEAGVEAIITDIKTIDDAARAYVDGTIENLLGRLH